MAFLIIITLTVLQQPSNLNPDLKLVKIELQYCLPFKASL